MFIKSVYWFYPGAPGGGCGTEDDGGCGERDGVLCVVWGEVEKVVELILMFLSYNFKNVNKFV